jgi:hypothetical protein
MLFPGAGFAPGNKPDASWATQLAGGVAQGHPASGRVALQMAAANGTAPSSRSSRA